MKVSKLGYYGGDPARVRNAQAYDIFNILDYENFQDEYGSTEYKLNE